MSVGADGLPFLALATISVTYTLSIRRLERLRRALKDGKLPNMLGVWTFCATLILPAPLLVALVAVVYAAEWPSRRIVGRGRPWRYAYSALTAAGACMAASRAYHAIGGFQGAALAIPTFYLLNMASIGAAVVVRRQWRVLTMFLQPKQHAIDIATQAGGACLAAVMAWHPLLGPGVVPALLLIHRVSLRQVVIEEEAVEPHSGLWSESAWSVLGAQLLKDTIGAVALLLVEPGPSVCDAEILRAINSEQGLRPGDLLGRYGDRRIAALIDVGMAGAGYLLADRFRQRLEDAGVDALIGVAVTSDEDLDEVAMWAVHDLALRTGTSGNIASW